MKSIFKAKETTAREVPGRIKKISTNDLLSWADTTIMVIGRSFDEYRYHDGPIEEALSSTSTLLDILTEVRARQ